MIQQHNRLSSVATPLPGPKSAELLARWHEAEPALSGTQAPIVWDHASGCVVTDVDGNRFLDWTSGVLVTNVGHCHPHLVTALQQAAGRLLNNYECGNVERIAAARRLAAALPAPLDRCFFLSTGSEAVEAACRLMKRKTGKFEILGFHQGFHGRTAHAAGAGGMASMKKGYGPSVPGMIHAPYPYPFRDPFGWCEDGPSFDRYFAYLDEVVYANSCGSLAGVIVEPYQGAGGFIFPPKGWLKRLEEWVRANGLLLTVDEVQSSFGRTGAMWAHQHEELRPDLMTLGKGLGCGAAVSAIAARAEIFDCLRPGELSSTYGGNPVASAAVTAVFDILEREGLIERARGSGERLKRMLETIDCPYIGEIRGRGLVMGIEFITDAVTKNPAGGFVRKLIPIAASRGLLIGAVGRAGHVVRVAPPLCITPTEIEESVELFREALAMTEQAYDPDHDA